MYVDLFLGVIRVSHTTYDIKYVQNIDPENTFFDNFIEDFYSPDKYFR